MAQENDYHSPHQADTSEEFIDPLAQARETFEIYRSQGDERESQRPYERLHQLPLYHELEVLGVIHVIHSEANSLGDREITSYDPGKNRLISILVQGGRAKLDPDKPHWFVRHQDVEYVSDPDQGMPWIREHEISLLKNEPQVRGRSRSFESVSVLYTVERELEVRGSRLTYSINTGFDPKESRYGIYPPENFDLAAFRKGLLQAMQYPERPNQRS